MKILKAPRKFSVILNSEEKSKKEGDYLLDFSPRSNIKNVKTDSNIDKTKRSVSVDFKDINPEKYDMFSKKKSIAAFSFQEVLRVKNELSKVNINISVAILKNAFLTPDTVNYPKYFLPNSAFGLLNNPFPDGKNKI